MVATAYGPAKMAEARHKRYLMVRNLPDGLRLVPYVEGTILHGVYVIEPTDDECRSSSGAPRFRVLETIPFLLLEDESRREVYRGLRAAGISMRPPEEFDLTASVTATLAKSEVLWRHAAANTFDLAPFVEQIRSVKSSPQFPDVYLIQIDDGSRWVMSVGRLIEALIDLHPHFMRLYQPEAVRVSYPKSRNTWIAPLRG